ELEMVANPFDGIEIGDVQRGRSGYGEERTPDRHRIVGGPKRRRDWAIIRARSAACMHDEAILEIERRNDNEIGHDASSLSTVMPGFLSAIYVFFALSEIEKAWPGEARP